MKLHSQLDNYLHYCKYNRDFADTTIRTKYYHINKFAEDANIYDLCELTNQDIDSWRQTKLDNGMSKKTINGYLDDVVTCVRYLRDKREEPITLRTEGLDRFRIHYDNEDLPSFNATEITNIKDHCVSLLERIVFSLTFESAMRLHEITKLDTADIRDEDGDKYFRISGKGGKRRNTFILPETWSMLERWCGGR